MPRKPSYRKHSPGQARVTIRGKTYYLGKHGSPESHALYEKLIAEYVGESVAEQQGPEREVQTIDRIALAYMAYVHAYYRKGGEETCEVYNIKLALRPLIRRFGHTVAADFGPRKLKAVRDDMISAGCVRTSINRQIGRIRRMFKWAASEELLDASVHTQLMTVDGLRAGRSKAKEPEPVLPVSREHMLAIEPIVSRQIWAMVELQWLTGMRPGEVIQMRACDIDRASHPWIYRPSRHKTQHHERDRIVALGPKAQTILKPFLIDCLWDWEFTRPDDGFLFSPADARREFDLLRRINRKTKMSPSHAKRQRKAKPERKPGGCYTTTSYNRAIRRACEKVQIPPWHPNQIRHSVATEVRHSEGLDVAQVMLGHANANVTQVYAERDLESAKKVALLRG